ncbi:acetolactate synthase I/III small subunit [Entomortierella parvispora]|uniref:Acetolactate synthase I/III small subunit n=1 Tax=Entomortierella parvispora TaxID=205924 RepID=A0A9P3LVP1_9FUNG|nr:acetolactate synthase I/III small subunit [Entomortierella parvispora]
MSFFRAIVNQPALALTKAAAVTAVAASVRSPRLVLPTIIRHSSSASAASDSSGADHGYDQTEVSRQTKRRHVHPLRSRDSLDPTRPSAAEAVSHILYNTPGDQQERRQRHVLNCLVQNEPGVLSRVAGILAGRGFNIDSLVVAKTEVTDLSRMTIVLRGEDETVEQARRQLEDLIPVWAVLDYTGFKLIQRELLLVKVSILGPEHVHMQRFISASVPLPQHQQQHLQQEPAMSPSKALIQTQDHLGSLTELSKLFQGRVVDVSSDSVVLEMSAKPDRIDAFIKLVKPFGILEAARSGMMAMPRSLIHDLYEGLEQDQAQEEGSGVDAALLPPG